MTNRTAEAELSADARHWKANHDRQVEAKRSQRRRLIIRMEILRDERNDALAEVSRLQKENERLRQMVAPIRSVVIYGRDAHDGALVGGVSMATWRSLLAELEHTDGR